MKISFSFLANAAIRLTAIGGKFVFILYAASAMPTDDFGRIGIVLAAAVLIIAAVGLEAYQVMLRKLVQGKESERSLVRSFYARFAVMGAITSGLLAVAIFWSFGWRAQLVGLAAIVVAVDHLNCEICRALVAEGKPTLSIIATSARTGLWAAALPILAMAGLFPSGLTDTTVLAAWLICSLGGILCFAPMMKRYVSATLIRDQARVLLREILRTSVLWVTVSCSWRALEFGGRLISGYLLGEAMSGRYTLLATLASLSVVALKGFVEPIYFSRIIAPDGDAELTRFSRLTAIIIGLTSIGSFAAFYIYTRVASEANMGTGEWLTLSLLTAAFATMSASQIWHFKLYRMRRDRAIFKSHIFSATIGVAVALWLTLSWGLIGTATGVLIGTCLLLGTKFLASRRIVTQ